MSSILDKLMAPENLDVLVAGLALGGLAVLLLNKRCEHSISPRAHRMPDNKFLTHGVVLDQSSGRVP